MINTLLDRIGPIRKQIVEHPLYESLSDLNDLRRFSEVHVFAVWDFMSLLKSLQRELTCVTIPWTPVGSANTRYLINEIVTGEESDVDPKGNRISHFELYLRAMKEMGSDTGMIESVIQACKSGDSIQAALQQADLPPGILNFCRFTFDLIEQAPVHVQAAVFTFGREDLIPDMFQGMVATLSEQYPREINTFRYYLERHIEVDGDHHSHLAMDMVKELCGNDPQKWEEAATACVRALELRRDLWQVAIDQLTTA